MRFRNIVIVVDDHRSQRKHVDRFGRLFKGYVFPIPISLPTLRGGLREQTFHFPRYRLLFSNDKLCDRANHRCNAATRCLDSDKGRTLEHRRDVEKETENRRTKLKLSMPIMIRAIASRLSKARPRETIYALGCRLFMWFA